MVANPVVTIPRSYQSWTALAASPGTDFELDAGNYGLTVAAGGFESYALQRLLPDGVTYAPVMPVATAAGYTVLDLPAGRYSMLVLVGAYCLCRCPIEKDRHGARTMKKTFIRRLLAVVALFPRLPVPHPRKCRD